jgi:hypothetical protein
MIIFLIAALVTAYFLIGIVIVSSSRDLNRLQRFMWMFFWGAFIIYLMPIYVVYGVWAVKRLIWDGDSVMRTVDLYKYTPFW